MKKETVIDRLLSLVTKVPILYCIATASSTYPNATADEILNELEIANDRNEVYTKYNLKDLSYNDSPVGYTKEELMGPYNGHVEMLCPFHLDTKLGSFKITPSKNMWYCFTCSKGGGQVQFERDYYDLGFVDAVFHLSYRLGFISKAEYLKRGSSIKINCDAVNLSSNDIIETKKEKKADPNIIHNVYFAMQKVCPLSDDDKEHLIKERGLDEEDLVNYFTYPTRRTNLPKKILNYIIDEYSVKKFGNIYKNLTKEQKAEVDNSNAINKLIEEFKYVPGFYYDTKKKKHDFVSYKGIGLLAKDEKGKITGVQIRKSDSKKSKGSRYVWLSSAFAQMEPDYEGGASSGSPCGVIYPKDVSLDTAAICITEGRFKAEQIVKNNPAKPIAIYLSGVSTWKSIKDVFLNLKGHRKNVYMFFDADMMSNTAVHIQLKELCEWLQRQGVTSQLVLWKQSRGKGFDDLKLAYPDNFKELTNIVQFEAFEGLYKFFIEELLKKFEVKKITDIKKEDVEDFTKRLQALLETCYCEVK